MKKSYVYFIAPVIGLIIFGVIYWQYAATYDARVEASEKKRQQERKEKIDRENESKKVAVEAALKSQEERKKAKAEKEARDQKEKDDRERAIQARSKAREDSRKFSDQVLRLQKDIKENQDEIEKIKIDEKRYRDEEAFVREAVKKTQANTQGLTAVLEKIDAADKAAAEAAKAAAAKK